MKGYIYLAMNMSMNGVSINVGDLYLFFFFALERCYVDRERALAFLFSSRVDTKILLHAESVWHRKPKQS